MTQPAPTIAELIRSHMEQLRPAERRVARTLLANYPGAGLSTAAELAELASVSAPTVVRFAARLGLDGYTDLQARLLSELDARRASPVSRAAAEINGSHPGDIVRRGGRHRAGLIVESLSAIPPSEVQAAVRALADPARTILLTGGYFSHLIARYFSIQLAQIRSRVHYVAEPAHRDVGYLLEASKRHVLVCFDLRRYEQEARVTVREARRRGATTIVITDEWLSPAAAQADIVLPVAVRAEPFDSLTAVLCLVESLIPALVSAIGPAAVRRMRAWEQLDARRHLLDASVLDDAPDEG